MTTDRLISGAAPAFGYGIEKWRQSHIITLPWFQGISKCRYFPRYLNLDLKLNRSAEKMHAHTRNHVLPPQLPFIILICSRFLSAALFIDWCWSQVADNHFIIRLTGLKRVFRSSRRCAVDERSFRVLSLSPNHQINREKGNQAAVWALRKNNAVWQFRSSNPPFFFFSVVTLLFPSQIRLFHSPGIRQL